MWTVILVNGTSMKSQLSSADRDVSVDFAKGMLMWCVVYGHSVDALCGGLSHSPVWLHGRLCPRRGNGSP